MPFLLFLLVSSAWAAGPGVRLIAEVGFAGWVIPDVWIPLRIDIASGNALEGIVGVEVPNGPPGTGVALYTRAVRLSAGARQRLTIPVVIHDPRRPLAVTVRDAGGDVLLHHTVSLGREQVVEGAVVALSSDAAGLEFLAGYSRRIRGAYLTEEDLPDHWATYGGVDLVVLRDVDERSLSSAQRQALQEWVAQGGRLLVTGEHVLQQHQAWLADLLPAVAAAALSIAPPAHLLAGMPGPLPVSVLRPKAGSAVLPRQGLPLVVSRPYGRGLVTAWAFDAFAPAVRAWPGRLALWDQVLSGRPARPVARPELIDVIPTARTVSGGAQAQIIALSALYILAIRFALRRFAARAGVWLALATVIVVFTFLLYTVSSAARRSAATTVQVTVLESTGAANLARVTTYVAVLLPYGGSYRVTLPAGSLVRPLAPVALVLPAGNVVSGDGAAGVLFLEAVQIVSLPLRGQTVARADGLDLEIENRSGLTIGAPSVYLNGQTQMLPGLSDRLAVSLPPGKWVRADRNAASGDFGHDAQAWISTRLDAYTTPAIIGYKTLWLLGAIREAPFAAQLEGASEQRGLYLLLSPIDVTGGR